MLLILMTTTSLTVLGQQTPTQDDSDKNQPSGATPNQPVKTSDGYVFPTKRERFDRFVSSTVGPRSFVRTAIAAGIQQWRDTPEDWEQGMSGYGKRFASSFGSNAIQQSVTYGFDSALGLDTGFQKSKRKGFFPRAKDAMLQNITSRTKSGGRVISIPRIAGAYAGGVVPTVTWYPERYSYKDGLRNGTYSLLTGFGLNLVREFVIKW